MPALEGVGDGAFKEVYCDAEFEELTKYLLQKGTTTKAVSSIKPNDVKSSLEMAFLRGYIVTLSLRS